MKRIISVSLGSSKRNHAVEAELLGERCVIERIGTDGNLKRAIELVKQLDGKVDAFGMGGIDLYVQAGGRRYMLREAKQIARAARITPIVDGTGLKDTLERKTVAFLDKQYGLTLLRRKVLMMCAVDRFGMAEAFAAHGADLTLGDLIFTVGLPIPLRSLRALATAARVLGPILTQLPLRYLYPTGAAQEITVRRGEHFFADNELIAGDFHFIRRFMPASLAGKIIITNTITKEDIALLKARGVKMLVTTTPEFNGRSFGTNVMEALLVALSGRPQVALTAHDYEALLDRLAFRPRIEELNVTGG
ncbi:MAG: quinate 5-dehydrogenase [Selenomonadales bacterium]|nr:quinate 5-dehydrogenase [Selenomonadales bacterium]